MFQNQLISCLRCGITISPGSLILFGNKQIKTTIWVLKVFIVIGLVFCFHPGLPGEEHRGFLAPLPLSPFYPPALDRRVDSPAFLEGFADLPDEAGLTTKFQTWPHGWFHIPKDPDFPVPS